MKVEMSAARGVGLAGAVALLPVVLLLAGCSAEGKKGAPATAAATPVEVVEIQPADVPIFSDFAAQTYARDMVEVRGRVDGYLERWLFRPGAEVRAGDVLYVLDLRPYEASVQQARANVKQGEADLDFARRQVSLLQAQANLGSAQANLTKAQQDYERLKPLVDADAASKQDLDAAVAARAAGEANVRALQASVDQATISTKTQIDSTQAKTEALKAALQTAELNLQYGTIRAPISGRIGDSLIPVGGLVNPNSAQPLTTIVPLDPIWVRFKVTESEYLSWVKRGQKTLGGDLPLRLILADGSEFPSKGQIADSLNHVDSTTGTLELQASFPNPQRRLLPGQFGRVRVQVDERNGALLAPQRAVQQLQNMQTVFTVGADNKVQARAVTTAERVGDLWVIDQGLKPGDRVIVEGQLQVRPGALVQPLPYREPAGTAKPKSGN
jgi:membrane fusion protein (multidrug efflux system)